MLQCIIDRAPMNRRRLIRRALIVRQVLPRVRGGVGLHGRLCVPAAARMSPGRPGGGEGEVAVRAGFFGQA